MSRIAEVEQVEMPKYVCHKEVRAFKIGDIQTGGMGMFSLVPAVAPGGIAPVGVDSDYIDRHIPQVGGYYVKYEDGYDSYSPAEAFESGYTLME